MPPWDKHKLGRVTPAEYVVMFKFIRNELASE